MVLVKKQPFFQLFFLGNIGQENVFCDILERKNAFLGYKNKKFKKSKTCHFFKGGQPMVLVQKLPYFQLFFQAIQARKMFFTIFQNEKPPFQALKTRSSKSRKIGIFPKGLNTWLKHSFLHRSIDVKFIFDSARLGLSSSANILQIADVALRVVCSLFLPCFWLVLRLVLFLEASEMSAVFLFHKQNNLTSSPGFLG